MVGAVSRTARERNSDYPWHTALSASDVGRGSSFLVYLPVVGQSEEVVVPKREEQITGGDGTILLVEDDEQVLQINSEILEMAGIRSWLSTAAKRHLHSTAG